MSTERLIQDYLDDILESISALICKSCGERFKQIYPLWKQP